MDSQQILNSLNRINSAIGVTWSNSILAASAHALHGTERLSVALLVGVLLVPTPSRNRVEREMRATVWHLWMTVVVNAALAAVRHAAASFVEQLAWSAIVLLVAEKFHSSGVVADGTATFLVSTKYLFAESLSTAFAEVHRGSTVPPALPLVIFYHVTQAYSPSPTVASAVGLMVFDALGDILLPGDSLPVNKLAIALALSVIGPRAGALAEHLREYSRWEGSREVIALGAGHAWYTALSCVVTVVFVEHLRTDRILRQAIHDISMLAVFDIVFNKSMSVVQHVFLSNTVIPFVLSLFLMSVLRTCVRLSSGGGHAT